VPWLAASGPLAYTPETPPERDYFFQYGWIMPSIANPDAMGRRHLYFGAHHRDDADEVFDFWRAAREGRSSRVAVRHGVVTRDSVSAPIAVYRHALRRGRAGFGRPHSVTPAARRQAASPGCPGRFHKSASPISALARSRI